MWMARLKGTPEFLRRRPIIRKLASKADDLPKFLPFQLVGGVIPDVY